MLELGSRVQQEREAKKKQVEWLRSRRVINTVTGEILTKKDGDSATLEDSSKSWYCGPGTKNNVSMVSRRCSKAKFHRANPVTHRPKLLTLTFADTKESWEKEGILSKFTNTLQHWAKRNGGIEPAYFWVDEVQAKNDRGAAHYHLLLLGFPYLPKELIEKWWAWGFSDIKAIDTVGRALSYLKKYMWKWAEVEVDLDSMPEWWFYYSIFSKRRFGFSRWFAFTPIERVPLWLKCALESMQFKDGLMSASRMVGGGWLCKIRGSPLTEDVIEFRMASPFKVQQIPAVSVP